MTLGILRRTQAWSTVPSPGDHTQPSEVCQRAHQAGLCEFSRTLLPVELQASEMERYEAAAPVSALVHGPSRRLANSE
jgi:hypothetical protein